MTEPVLHDNTKALRDIGGGGGGGIRGYHFNDTVQTEKTLGGGGGVCFSMTMQRP